MYNQAMLVVFYILTGLIVAILIIAAAIKPTRTTLSLFELRRREKLRDKVAEDALAHEELLARISRLWAPLRILLLVALALLLVYIFGWTKGILLAVVFCLLYERVARFQMLSRIINALYARSEARLLALMAKYETVIKVVGGDAPLEGRQLTAGSPEEIAHMIESSQIFSSEDTTLLKNALRFRRQLVSSIMTPAASIVSVQYTDLLGPLVLDDLHKTGHTIFPVMKDSSIVGMLDSTGHAALQNKESVYVYNVMHTDVAWLSESSTLDEALRTLMDSKQPLLIVTDEAGKTVGLLSLGDVVRALTGWEQG